MQQQQQQQQQQQHSASFFLSRRCVSHRPTDERTDGPSLDPISLFSFSPAHFSFSRHLLSVHKCLDRSFPVSAADGASVAVDKKSPPLTARAPSQPRQPSQPDLAHTGSFSLGSSFGLKAPTARQEEHGSQEIASSRRKIIAEKFVRAYEGEILSAANNRSYGNIRCSIAYLRLK